LIDDLTKKGGSAIPGETAIHVTVKAMTEGGAQMMVDRVLALYDAIKHLPYSKKESD
jgi:hypothetical protein